MSSSVAEPKLTVLVVDDEEPIRELVGWMLEDFGHVVQIASGGQQALQLMRCIKTVDVVLSDINMPDMDGVELARQIEAEFPTTPVVLVSGRPRPEGVQAFISKPFRSESLANAIALATTGKPQRRHPAGSGRGQASGQAACVELGFQTAGA